MSKLSIQECQQIYDAAIEKRACTGQANAAKRALDAGDAEAFERICRGSMNWLRCNGIAYALTDGVGEIWRDNGVLYSRANYKNGELHGLYEELYANGTLWCRVNCANGKRHGVCEVWCANGVLSSRVNYVNGVFVSDLTNEVTQ